MQVTQTAEYAMRAVIWLGQHPGDPQTTQQIAANCQMPAGYLAKVLQPLARAGIVSAQRGLGGGYLLARDADDITLLDVVNAVDPIQRIRGGPLTLPGDVDHLCALRDALNDAMAGVEGTLASLRIGQLLKQKKTDVRRGAGKNHPR